MESPLCCHKRLIDYKNGTDPGFTSVDIVLHLCYTNAVIWNNLLSLTLTLHSHFHVYLKEVL